MPKVTGNDLVVQTLKNEGVDTVFYLTGGPMSDVAGAVAALWGSRIDRGSGGTPAASQTPPHPDRQRYFMVRCRRCTPGIRRPDRHSLLHHPPGTRCHS